MPGSGSGGAACPRPVPLTGGRARGSAPSSRRFAPASGLWCRRGRKRPALNRAARDPGNRQVQLRRIGPRRFNSHSDRHNRRRLEGTIGRSATGIQCGSLQGRRRDHQDDEEGLGLNPRFDDRKNKSGTAPLGHRSAFIRSRHPTQQKICNQKEQNTPL